MKYLVVAAHPDDEVLGAGATMYDLIQNGHEVGVVIMNQKDKTRYGGESAPLVEDLEKSLRILGVEDIFLGTFPDLEFGQVPHRELVSFIEYVIMKWKPSWVITHSTADSNLDHYHTSIACQQAIRWPQRGIQEYESRIFGVYFMEVLSSTDWNLDPAIRAFNPNVFVGVSDAAIEKKIEALRVYQGVIRPLPHPRSPEAIRALAVLRGVQAGVINAEAFYCAFRRGL